MQNGVPQGSVLSFILFILTINDIFSYIDRPVKASIFADDLTLTCFGKEINTTTKIMQKTLNKIQNLSEKTGFKFSKTKTEFIVITKQKFEKEPKLLLENHPLVRKQNLKIEGLIFDEKLSWTIHIKHLKTECLK